MSTQVTEQTARQCAKDVVDAGGKDSVVLRALVLLLIDELNTLRSYHSLPNRTLSQLKTALKNRIDTGDAD